ncbi:hypothetical protein BH09PSE1_BH09PSE1_02260 [soil metagenome]
MTNDESPPETAPLTSDELGDVGESTFKLLCSKGPLIANGAGRDRAGWDFVVQAQAENAPAASLDDRTVLWTSYVQVKAAWKGRRTRVRLSLSAAEMLAKQTEPAFVAALLYDRSDLERFDLYMVEMTGDRLAAILKALREHERNGTRAVNAAHIYITLHERERLRQATGPAIRERLAQAHRGAAPETYATVKGRELKTIGYDERPIRGVMTLYDIDQSGLFDALLGKTTWKSSISGMVETRFGVDLPLSEAPEGMGRIRFSPAPQAACDLVVTSKGGAGRLNFTGDHHHLVLPGSHGLVDRSRFYFPGFTVDQGEGPIVLNTDLSEDTELTLGDWRLFWRLMEALRDRQTAFTLRSPRFSEPLRWAYSSARERFPSDVRANVLVAEAAFDLVQELNLAVGRITMGELASQSKAVMMARHFGRGGRPKLRIAIASVHQGEPDYDRSPQDGVYADFVDLGGQRIGFATRMRLACRDDGGEDVWESTRERRLEVRRIGAREQDFAMFADEAKSLAGVTKLFLGDIDAGFLQGALGDIAEF